MASGYVHVPINILAFCPRKATEILETISTSSNLVFNDSERRSGVSLKSIFLQ